MGLLRPWSWALAWILVELFLVVSVLNSALWVNSENVGLALLAGFTAGDVKSRECFVIQVCDGSACL